MSFQFSPILLLEETDKKIAELQLAITNGEAIIAKGIGAFGNPTVTTVRNQFSSEIRTLQKNISRLNVELENKRILEREIELTEQPSLTDQEAQPTQGIDLKKIAIIGAIILLFS